MKRTKRLLLVSLAALPLLAYGGFTIAQGADRADVSDAVSATASFHDLDTAQKAGYSFHLPNLAGQTCISNGAVGAMGDHFVNTSLLDGNVDPVHPEALVYSTKPNGTYQLVALEYVATKPAWDEAHGTDAAPPVLFGRTFDTIPAPNQFGLPTFYALHVWIWKPNPSGLFFAWNPSVSCPA